MTLALQDTFYQHGKMFEICQWEGQCVTIHAAGRQVITSSGANDLRLNSGSAA